MSIHKVDLKWIMVLNVKSITVRPLKENIREYFYGLERGKNLLAYRKQ